MYKMEEMKMDEKRKAVLNRLKTVKGHISGIERMLEEGKSCDEVLMQVLAVKSSLHKVGLLIMENHAMDCLLTPDEDGKVDVEHMEQVIKTIINFSK